MCASLRYFAIVKYLLSLFILISAFSALAQYRIRGIVTDDEGIAVGFCHVYNISMGTGKVADMKGRFEVLARKDDTIRFSYVGYQTVELEISSIHLVNYMKVIMQEDSILLPSITIYADPYYKVPLNIKGDPIFIPGVSVTKPRTEIKPGTISWGVSPGLGGIPSGGATIMGPITYFSRDAREERKAEELFAEDMRTISYQIFIAEDSVKQQLCTLYDINGAQYDTVLRQLHQQFPGIQTERRPPVIWQWLLDYFDQTVPFVKGF